MKTVNWVICGCTAVACSIVLSAVPSHRAAAQAPPVNTTPPTPAPPTGPPPAPVAETSPQPTASEKPPKTVVRIYDVGDLVQAIPDRPLGQGVLPPTQLNGILGVRPSSYNINNTNRPADPTEQSMDSLVKLIGDQIDPDTWRQNGGLEGAISTRDKALIVRQTEENQKQVAELLELLRKGRQSAKVVTVHADWVWLGPGDMQQITKADKSGNSGREIDPVALQKLGPKALYAHGQITCAGGQTVHMLSGHVKTLVENLDASVGTGASAYQPEVDQVLEGAAIQVTPRIEGESAGVDVLGFVSGWGTPGAPYHFLLQSSATATAAPGSASRPGDAESAANANSIATMDRMNVLAQEFATTAHLPLGKSIVIGGMTLEPEGAGAAGDAKADAKGASARQLYLILRVDAD